MLNLKNFSGLIYHCYNLALIGLRVFKNVGVTSFDDVNDPGTAAAAH